MMLQSSKLIAFIGTKDAAGAKAFYRDTLGLRLISEDSFAMVFDANGMMLRVTPVPKLIVAPYTVLGWEVSDIKAKARKLCRKGVKLERYAEMEQDDLGIWSAPSGAKVCWFKDRDGNLLSLMTR
jgi:catechol 2,3-dioxygenase-like lactoylglutathione lyase family enzyme